MAASPDEFTRHFGEAIFKLTLKHLGAIFEINLSKSALDESNHLLTSIPKFAHNSHRK